MATRAPIRWRRVIAFVAVTAIVILVVGATPLAVHSYREYQESKAAEPNPIVASTAQQNAIVAAVGLGFGNKSLLSDRTAALCSDASPPRKHLDCWHIDSLDASDFYMDFPVRLRRELLMANAERAMQGNPGLESVAMVEQSEIDRITREGGRGEEFWQRFPDTYSYQQVSRAVLSADGTHALIAVGNFCGSNCGSSGGLIYLREAQGSWRVAKAEMVWTR